MIHGFLRRMALLLAFLSGSAAHGASFIPCEDAGTHAALKGSLCARETAPMSHAADAAAGGGEQLTLFIRKFPAQGERRGTVWLVAGGPGESGASFYPFIDSLRRSFPGFDLLVPDHRGTGFSSRLCPLEESASSPGGMALSRVEWGSCYAGLNAQPARARAFTITHAAHDLRQLILRHQDGKPVYVLGVSYGTQLVLRALQIGRLPLAGLVLDSLVPMETAERWDLSRRVLAASAREPARLAGVPGGSLPRFLGRLLDMPALRARIPWLLRELNGPDGKPGAELARITEELARAGAALGGHPQ